MNEAVETSVGGGDRETQTAVPVSATEWPRHRRGEGRSADRWRSTHESIRVADAPPRMCSESCLEDIAGKADGVVRRRRAGLCPGWAYATASTRRRRHCATYCHRSCRKAAFQAFCSFPPKRGRTGCGATATRGGRVWMSGTASARRPRRCVRLRRRLRQRRSRSEITDL